MIFRGYSIRQALRTWGDGLSWLFAILSGWILFGLSVQSVDESVIIWNVLASKGPWGIFQVVLIGGAFGSWLWICFRAVLSAEPAWKIATWITIFGLGCWWLAESPLFDHQLSLGRSADYRGASVYNAKHGAYLLLILGSIWLVHPIVQQIQWTQEKQVLLEPVSSVWRNRWVVRGIVFFVAVFGARTLTPRNLDSSTERWQYELCQTEHVIKLLVPIAALLFSLRILAIVNRTWFQCLAWPVLLSGWACLAWWLLGTDLELSGVTFLVGPCLGVLCIHFWFMNFLGFRIVVPRTNRVSAISPPSHDEPIRVDQKTLAFAYVGTAVVLFSCLASLNVLRNEFCLGAYFVESTNQWETSSFLAKCQAWYRDYPIPEENLVALEIHSDPIQYQRKDSINMMVSQALNQAPGWNEFRLLVERKLPIHFQHAYPISSAAEFAANVEMPVMAFDQARRPLREFVRMRYPYGQFKQTLVVFGGVVTDADLNLLPGSRVQFVGCHFPDDAKFLIRQLKPDREVVFRDCTFTASALTSLAKARLLQRTITVTDHQQPTVPPDMLIEAAVHGVEVEFPGASKDWTPVWLTSEQARLGRLVRVRSTLEGRRLGIAPPWEFLFDGSPLPASMSGKLTTDENGKIVQVYWGGFTELDVPTEDPAILREAEFAVPSLVISASELNNRFVSVAEARFNTLLEIVKRSDFIEFVDVLDPKIIAKLSIVDFPNSDRPTIVRKSYSELSAESLALLPWVETIATDISSVQINELKDFTEYAEKTNLQNDIAACVVGLPNLKKLIFLTNPDSHPYSYEWFSEDAQKSITIELIPSDPSGSWRSTLGLIR